MAKEALVVCYSRSGTVRRVASHIAAALGAELELIEEVGSRLGVGGYMRSLLEAAAKGLPAIRTRKDPGDYELVVLGTPVWAGTMSSPVRSYIFSHQGELQHARFFAVMGGRGGENAVREMQLASGSNAAAACVLTQREAVSELYRVKCESFIKALKQDLLAGKPPSPSAHAA
jgi:flavodoxin